MIAWLCTRRVLLMDGNSLTNSFTSALCSLRRPSEDRRSGPRWLYDPDERVTHTCIPDVKNDAASAECFRDQIFARGKTKDNECIKHRGSVFFHTLGRKMKLAVVNFADTFTAQNPCLALVHVSIKTYKYTFTLILLLQIESAYRGSLTPVGVIRPENAWRLFSIPYYSRYVSRAHRGELI